MWKIIDKIGLFLSNVFNAIKFAAFDYDVVLRRTKTPKQRLLIWIIIITVVLLVLFIILSLIGGFIQKIVKQRIELSN